MGHALPSYYKRGYKCYKCGKKLMRYKQIKGHYDYDTITYMYFPEKGIIRLMYDPSEGKTSGYLYGFMCVDCWRKENADPDGARKFKNDLPDRGVAKE